MADATVTPEIHDEPAPLNPTLGDDSIKKIASKFRELMQQDAPEVKDAPDPLKLAQPAVKAEDKKEGDKPPVKADESKTEVADPRQKLPSDENPRRAEFRKLEQSRDDYRRQFEETKKAMEEREARIKKMEDDLANWRKALPADPDTLVKSLSERETVAKERDELVKTIETLNLERSPRFQRWWNEETSKHLKLAQRAVNPEHRDTITKLLMEASSSERDAKLDEIIEALPKVAQRTIHGALENLEAIKLQREEALTRGSEEWKRLQEVERQEKVKETQAREQKINKLTKAALDYARTNEAFKEIKDNAEHNAAIAEREAFVKAAIQGQIDEDLAIMLPAAAAESLYLKKTVIPNLKAEVEKLNKAVKELQSADPRPSGGGGGGKPSPTPDAESGSRFAAKVRELMNG